MSGGSDAASAALIEVDRIRAAFKRKRTKQVWSQDERTLVKATASAWFNDHRKHLSNIVDLAAADKLYQNLLNASDRATSRSSYTTGLKALREILLALRGQSLTMTEQASAAGDAPPDFSPLSSDANMQGILRDRWEECVRCVDANAPLAATVMMGGLLETMLLGRINRESNQAPIYTAKAAPKDKAGKTLQLREWGLKDYIAVAHELKWITVSAREVADVLRDFRNYIHPHKQHTHGVKLSHDDAALFWGVSKSITVQVLKSCQPATQ